MKINQAIEDLKNKRIRGSKTREVIANAIRDMQTIGHARVGFTGISYFLINDYKIEDAPDGMGFIVYADA